MKLNRFLLIILVLLISISHSFSQRHSKRLPKWEYGVSLSNLRVQSEVKPLFPSLGWGLIIRKPVEKWLAFQLNYQGGVAKGINPVAAYNYARNPAWASDYNAPILKQTYNGQLVTINSADGEPYSGGDPVYYNYRTTIHQFSLQVRLAVRIESSNPEIGFFVDLGKGVFFYNTMVNTKDGNGSTYTSLFHSLASNTALDRKSVLQSLRNNLDKTYETKAETESGNKHLYSTLNAGIGITAEFKTRFQLEIGTQKGLTNSSLIDGQRWNEYPTGDPSLSKTLDKIQIVSVSLIYKL